MAAVRSCETPSNEISTFPCRKRNFPVRSEQIEPEILTICSVLKVGAFDSERSGGSHADTYNPWLGIERSRESNGYHL